MKKYMMVGVAEKTHARLIRLKISGKAKNLDAVIKNLLRRPKE